jgi:hypothetical protein
MKAQFQQMEIAKEKHQTYYQDILEAQQIKNS